MFLSSNDSMRGSGGSKDFHNFVQRFVLNLIFLMEHLGYFVGKLFELSEGHFVLCY